MYKIIYEDGSKYEVDKIYYSVAMNQENWDKIKNPICRFEYYANGKSFILKNYEMYNHLIEYAHVIGVKGLIIDKIVLMGLIGHTVTAIVLNIKKKKIEEYHAKLGQEYNGGLTTGWKKGIFDKSAGYSIN